nr:hypothetical protein [Actinomycetota bacterium]
RAGTSFRLDLGQQRPARLDLPGNGACALPNAVDPGVTASTAGASPQRVAPPFQRPPALIPAPVEVLPRIALETSEEPL